MQRISYLPHSVCLRGNHSLIMLHVWSDLLIAFSYLLIPACAVLFLLRVYRSQEYRDFLFQKRLPIGILTALFVFACGAGHALNALTFFCPVYWVEGWWKLLTGIVSLTTALVLAKLALHDDDTPRS